MSDTSAAERIDRLRSIPLFAECSDASLQMILDLATEFEAGKGHVLAQPNQPGAGLFVVEEGSVTVELPGRKVELGPGEFFWEMALLDEEAAHTARVSVAEPVTGLAIARDEFAKMLHNEPGMAVAMLKVVARRLAAMSKRGRSVG